MPSRTPDHPKAVIPRSVWGFGINSFFMEISNNLIHGVLPIYLLTALKLSISQIGIIEGIAEATNSVMKASSGALSDRMGKRKPLTVLGYGLTTLARMFYPFAGTYGQVTAVRFVERFGVGTRSSTRDALIADVTPAHSIGASFGLRQTCDKVGAIVGPLLATYLMLTLNKDYQTIFGIAVIPSVVAFFIIVFMVHDAPKPVGAVPEKKLHFTEMGRLGAPLWWFIILAFFLHLSMFSDAFMLLRGSGLGIEAAYIPMIVVAQSSVQAVISYPFGRLSDKIGRPKLVGAGLVTMVIAHVVMALADTSKWVIAGAMIWGVYRATTRGLLLAMVADLAPARLRGTAYGLFHLLNGVALLVANGLGGWLWQAYGAELMYTIGAVVSGFSFLCYLVWVRFYGSVLTRN
jgi:MFS family permease